MNILIVGHNGMLGSDMMIVTRSAGHDVTGIDVPDIDITKRDSIQRCLAAVKPQIIINCAAYTAVDACETARERAFAVNAQGAGLLAGCAHESQAVLVHFSTDYVFDGTKAQPYLENDPTNPVSVYGKSKLEGELLVQKNCSRSFIFRIAWLYGARGGNFVKTIKTLAQKNLSLGMPLRVVNDQVGTPTWTVTVCRQTFGMIETKHYGLYHCTSEGRCSWYDFALEIVRTAGIEVQVVPCSTAEFPRPAPRPANSVLENGRLKELGLNIMPYWKAGFENFLKDEKK